MAWAFLLRRSLLRLADWLATAPLLRWIWAGPSSEELVEALVEFRPADRESVLEMMAGRYLLASRLVDTHGVSPFSVDDAEAAWSDELRGFSWLRHFDQATDAGARSFARTLVLDWIGREGRLRRPGWAPAVGAQRVLNWLRHLNLLIDGATPEQQRTILRSLRTQIQSLKLRTRLASDPVDQLLTAIALAGAALCDERRSTGLDARMRRLLALLRRDVGADGLHLTRSARVQLLLLVELETLRQALMRDHDEYGGALGEVVEGMHRALDGISLSTGEPAYFNGTGQLPHDLVVAVQVQSTARFRRSGTVGGYGRLVEGRGVVVADGGLVPRPAYAGEAHASALAFEFSYGSELVVGNCGPAPAELEHDGLVFRQGLAHSGITINGVSAARVETRGPFAGRVLGRGRPGSLAVEADGESLTIATHGYEARYGVTLERRLTLMAEGKSLVGQDRVIATRPRRREARVIARFHLALGTTLEPADQDDLLRVRLASGAVWNFLWEGAELRLEDSVRQSSWFGFRRTRQIVLDAPLEPDREIAWIFTLDEHRPGNPRGNPRRGL